MLREHKISGKFSPEENIVVYPGNCLELLKEISDKSIQLIVTSPPYNLGKEYERKLKLEHYLEQQSRVIKECVRALSPRGRS